MAFPLIALDVVAIPYETMEQYIALTHGDVLMTTSMSRRQINERSF